jgi:hypothetical protein
MSDNRIGFGGNIDGVLKPEKKPDVPIKNLLEHPLPSVKPENANEKDDAETRLKDRIKMQKKMIDFIRKGMKTGPAFIYELNKKTQEIMHEKNNGPI